MAKALRSLPVRFIVLLAAIIIYALFGSPTPDDPGLPEILIALFLALACAPSIPLALSGRVRPALTLFLLYGLSVPLLAGCLQGHDAALIVRDIIPFLFLCLPLFLTNVAGFDARTRRYFTGAICVAGLVFALRALGPAYGYLPPAGELYYLSNAPTVLFTAIFMAGTAVMVFSGALTPRRILHGVFALIVVMTILWSMLLDTQRGTIAAVILSTLVFLGAVFMKSPRRVVMPLLVLGGLLAVFLPLVHEALQAMAQKTAKVGLNMRLEELQAVIDTVSASPWTVLFGTGWGAKIASPAVAGIAVNFTHSLLSYLLLKTGVVGLLIAVAWLWRVAADIFIIARNDVVPSAGLAWALVIPVLFYASHKSLDFGLILLLVAVLADGLKGQVATAKSGV